jgi:DNA helicase-2/ATP-dependent DNA helicase PcrA
MFHADLHIHSRFSRACSKDSDLPHLASWALRKGITVVGTGDFTHPGWADELKESLIPAEPGLFRLRPEMESEVRRGVPGSCGQPVRFMLSVEISTIYRRDERTRKVHHLIYVPEFGAADRITGALSKIGNLASDGRPILGLDSRDLLEITLEAGPGCYLVPAHIWTPWFAVLGSASGFDAVTECYGDLSDHIFAAETGLSSDPRMNWMCSSLDAYRLVSNSDAHSPPMLGREATAFTAAMDYFSIAEALRTGDGLEGTVEFYPEEGKYHLDGHRKCGVRLDPRQTRERGGLCPVCHKPLTVGVLHRVMELADRPDGYRPAGAAGFTNLVPLPEIIGEISSVGPKSKAVAATVARLVAAFGPELAILREIPPGDLARVGGSLLGEAIARLRRGEAVREAGYDGEYGRVRLFRPGELSGADALFDIPAPSPAAAASAAGGKGSAAGGKGGEEKNGKDTGRARGCGGPRAGSLRGTTVLDGLDPDQRAAATAEGPLMIIAGPGTGKTRTLTHRIASLIAERHIPADHFLAITFTRRAAEEMRQRLRSLLADGSAAPRDASPPGNPRDASGVTVTTFHGLALRILRAHPELAGLPPGFRVAGEAARAEAAAAVAGSLRDGRRLLAGLDGDPGSRGDLAAQRDALRAELAGRGLVDLADLVGLAVSLLRGEPEVAAALRARWPQISVDEYQDIDEPQYELLRLLSGDGRGLTVIGDPDQAIYGFRGADVRFFLRFTADYPGAATVHLTRNYRSSPVIVQGALQAIAPATLVPGRELRAMAGPAAAPAGEPESPGGPGSAGGGVPGRRSRAPGGDGLASGDISPAITFHEAADEHAEAAWIAGTIDKLLGGSSFHSLDSGQVDSRDHDGALGLSDVAVLYRTDAQAAPLAQALTRAGLPFQKRSHDLLARRPGVRELVSQMRLTGEGAGDGSCTGVADRLRAAVRHLVTAMPGASPAAVDIRAAGEVLAPLARRCGEDMERFLTEISLGAEADSLEPRADAITLLTLHAAKGLEFRVVFIAGCEKGLLPLWLPGAAPGTGGQPPAGPGPVTVPAGAGPAEAGLADDGSGGPVPSGPRLAGVHARTAEERRLLFVGMTRARERLFLTCAARRGRAFGTSGPGSPSAAGPSPFLAAIDPALLTRTAPQRRRPAGRQLRLL